MSKHKDGGHKGGQAPKSGKHAGESKHQRGERKLAKAGVEVHRSGSKAGGGGGSAKNGYLAALTAPELVVGQKIPDDNTTKSCTLRTQHVVSATVDTIGNAVYCFAPALQQGGLKVTTDTAGSKQLSLIASTSADLAGTQSTDGGIFQVVSVKQQTAIQTAFTDLRPVSMSVTFKSVVSDAVAQGVVHAGWHGRGQWPAQIDDTNQPNFASAASFFLGTQNNGFATLADAIDAQEASTNGQRSMTALWKPQDSASRIYRAVAPVAGTSQSQANYAFQAGQIQWWAFGYNNVTAGPVVHNDLYFFPANFIGGSLTVFQDGVGGAQMAGSLEVEALNPELIQPYLMFVLEGMASASAGGPVGEFQIDINWEAIPLESLGDIMSPSPSPADPMRLAHAENIAAEMPSAYSADEPASPQAKAVASAMAAAGGAKGHANDTDSFFDTALNVASKVAQFAPMVAGMFL